jgi:putative PIN family toxin of toxin-antitoxin system
MRIVLDANVLASGVFWAGYPFRVLELWANDAVQVLASQAILQEYARTLRELGRHEEQSRLADAWVSFVFHHAALIDVRSPVRACRDPDDDKYLACAVDGGADYLVSGDKDLLSLESFRGIPIVKPRPFVEAVLSGM